MTPSSDKRLWLNTSRTQTLETIMRVRAFYDYEPEPEHPAKRNRPHHIASLYVHAAEQPDFHRICKAHGATEIVGVRKVPVIPAQDIDVLCSDTKAAMALMVAWSEFCETSPYRPHSKEEALAMAERHGPEVDIPRDWRF
jgi:hypothetical protein